MSNKRLLLISVSIGNGHTRAAEALERCAAIRYPDVEVMHQDIISLTPLLFRKTYKDAYLKLVSKYPELWGYLYTRMDEEKADSALNSLRKKLEAACMQKLAGVLEAFCPDHILCTHFLPQQVLLGWKDKGRVSAPLWSCVTDFVAHSYWMDEGLQGYFSATEENAFRMRRRGLENVFVTGIPVMPDFRPVRPKGKADAARSLGLDPDKKTLLIMGGGTGIGNLSEIARELLALRGDAQLLVLAGKNRSLLGKLRSLAGSFPDRLFPLGFTDKVATLLAACDLVVTKPGGLTSVECLAMGRPMLVYGPIPGQETRNADILLENGAAMKAEDTSGLLWRVEKLLAEPDTLAAMAKAAGALGKPEAAADILDHMMTR